MKTTVELTPAFKSFKEKQKEMYELHLNALNNVWGAKNLKQAYENIEDFHSDVEMFIELDGDEDLEEMVEYALNQVRCILIELENNELTLDEVQGNFETIGWDIDGASHIDEPKLV